MVRYLGTRLISAALVVLGVSCLVFMMIHLVPGDPVEVMLGETASAVDREALRRQLGLDQSLPVQFLDFMKGLLQLDLELFPYAPYARRVWDLRGNLTSYDAWYVALAEALDCPLLTLDQRLSRAVGPVCDVIVPPT